MWLRRLTKAWGARIFGNAREAVTRVEVLPAFGIGYILRATPTSGGGLFFRARRRTQAVFEEGNAHECEIPSNSVNRTTTEIEPNTT